ncbi:MAG: hypothetical protein JXB49_31725 [Bacteroidales bacterium]|nr:hypothetical protein [Bacteroidales bacterium]
MDIQDIKPIKVDQYHRNIQFALEHHACAKGYSIMQDIDVAIKNLSCT